ATMTKYEGISARVKQVTVNDFGRYFNSIENYKNGIFCYICGGNDWDLHRSPDDKERPVIITFPIPDKDGMGVWAFYVMCKNCGGMHFINANKVANWLDNKEK
ncbi:hypothetical protein ACTFCE_11230, partial [Escherichia coli]|uniref:hypothetical protein n=1 Tax=Escherichia coli TaxID=562 RepID=UPI003F76A31D